MSDPKPYRKMFINIFLYFILMILCEVRVCIPMTIFSNSYFTAFTGIMGVIVGYFGKHYLKHASKVVYNSFMATIFHFPLFICYFILLPLFPAKILLIPLIELILVYIVIYLFLAFIYAVRDQYNRI
jgi:uncharacterized membrane protein YgdD (TMEM256/DUF423 family)